MIMLLLTYNSVLHYNTWPWSEKVKRVSLVDQMVKNLPAMQEIGFNPGSGRSPREGNCYPLQYSCLENSMDRQGGLQSYDTVIVYVYIHVGMYTYTHTPRHIFIYRKNNKNIPLCLSHTQTYTNDSEIVKLWALQKLEMSSFIFLSMVSSCLNQCLLVFIGNMLTLYS